MALRLRSALLVLAVFVVTLVVTYQLQVEKIEIVIEYYDVLPAGDDHRVKMSTDSAGQYGEDKGDRSQGYRMDHHQNGVSDGVEMAPLWQSSAKEEAEEIVWEEAELWRREEEVQRFKRSSYAVGWYLDDEDEEKDEEYNEATRLEAAEVLLLRTLAERTDVHLPEKLERCIGAEVVLTLHCDSWQERDLLELATRADLSASAAMRVEITCSAADKLEGMHHTSPEVQFSRWLPMRHRQRNEGPFVERFGTKKRELPFVMDDNTFQLAALFFPDDSTDQCTLRLSSNVEGALEAGVLERDYEVQEKPIVQGNCWWCYGKLHHDFPLALDYYLVTSKGEYLSPNDELHFYTEKPMVIWIKPTDAARALYGRTVESTHFNAWLSGPHIRQSLRIEPYDFREGGYKVVVDATDALASYLLVTQQAQWPYSKLLTEDPEPILLSSHMSHEINDCDLGRSEVYGSRVEVRPSHRHSFKSPIASPERPTKCTHFNVPGRWLYMAEDMQCEIPYCTGDKEAAEVSSMSWQGATYPFVWVPFDCYIHYYSMDDLGYCAEQQGIKWIHTMGDSLSREFVGYMISVYGMPDTQKFEHSDSILNETRIRMTFQSWQDMLVLGPEVKGDDNRRNVDFLKLTLDHYNLLEANTSQPVVDFALNLLEEMNVTEHASPDVFVMNPAAAYAIFQQTAEAYDQFMEDFMGLVGNRWDRWERGEHRVRAYWYGQPFIHGTAHPGTEFLTQGRSEVFRDITREHLDGHAFPYIDPTQMTSCRWEDSFDGLHYLLGTTHWNGHVTASVMQMLLNEMMGSCSGRPTKQ